MLRGEFPDAGERSPESLRRAYDERLAAVIEDLGPTAVAAETGIDEATIEALAAGDSPAVTLREAAAILALDDERPDADAIAAEARDLLLMAMTTAVVDVERVAAGIDGDLEPKEIQQKIEGRAPTTLAEYARLHRFLEAESP